MHLASYIFGIKNKNMKKLSLSLGLIITFAFYVLFSSSKSIPVILPSDQASGTSAQQPQGQEKAFLRPLFGDDFDDDDEIPMRKRAGQATAPTGTATSGHAQPGGMMGGGMGGGMMGQYKNGAYTGNVADAYYGNVQVKAVISGGRISDVQFLQYPSDRQHSLELSNYAMPVLTQEAIQIQNSNVDIVSGATETSLAFRDSLASALSQAK